MIAMDTILVANAGSSSVKFQIFAIGGDYKIDRQIKGQMDGIGTKPRLRAKDAAGNTLAERAYPLKEYKMSQLRSRSQADGCATSCVSIR